MSKSGVRSQHIIRIVGVLSSIQAIQICNLIPLLIDPRPEFLLGLVLNFTTGLLALPVAYVVWTRRKNSLLITLLFGIFAFTSATYFGHLVAIHFGMPFFFPPSSMPPIIMAVNFVLIILLLFTRLRERSFTEMSR